MTTKAKLSIVAILSCCALVGVGFANWTISQGPVSQNVQVSVSAEPVLSYNVDVGNLHYSSQGFTSGEAGDAPTYGKGALSVTYTIISGGYTGKATLSVTMGYSETVSAGNLFAYAQTQTSSTVLTATAGSTMSQPTSEVKDNSFVVTVSNISIGSEETTVTIDYVFSFSSLDDYQTYFFTPFSTDENLKFTFDATLTGGN